MAFTGRRVKEWSSSIPAGPTALDDLAGWVDADPRQPPMPFIVGVARSGTTLLRLMLDAHPELAISPETGFLVDACSLPREGEQARERFLEMVTGYHTWKYMGISAEALRAELHRIDPFDLSDGVRSLYRLYAERFEKPRFGDKTPMYTVHLLELQDLLPEASFIHIIRDGRDIALSVRPFWFSPGKDMGTIAADWRHRIRTAREQGARCHRYMEIRFENLVLNPEHELRRACEFVQVEFDPGMLRYFETAPQRLREIGFAPNIPDNPIPELAMKGPEASRIFTWKREMSRRDRIDFELVAADTLHELGYETSVSGAGRALGQARASIAARLRRVIGGRLDRGQARQPEP